MLKFSSCKLLARIRDNQIRWFEICIDSANAQLISNVFSENVFESFIYLNFDKFENGEWKRLWRSRQLISFWSVREHLKCTHVAHLAIVDDRRDEVCMIAAHDDRRVKISIVANFFVSTFVLFMTLISSRFQAFYQSKEMWLFIWCAINLICIILLAIIQWQNKNIRIKISTSKKIRIHIKIEFEDDSNAKVIFFVTSTFTFLDYKLSSSIQFHR